MTSMNPTNAGAAAPKRCGLAIASLICGIVGPCTVGLASIAGIILGIMSLSKIKQSGGQLTGRGLGLAGIMVSVVGLLILAVFLALGGYGLIKARDAATAVMAMSNAKQLGFSAMMYAQSNKEQFPPADTWPQVFTTQYDLPSAILAAPGDSSGSRMFAMNARLGGVRQSGVMNSSQTVLFFECAPGSPPSGGRELMPPAPRFDKGFIISFVDGHVEAVPQAGLDKVIWDPKAMR